VALWLGVAIAVFDWVGLIIEASYPSDASVYVDSRYDWTQVSISSAVATMIGAACIWGLLRLNFPQKFRLKTSANASKADASS